jgi:hypothetical protein
MNFYAQQLLISIWRQFASIRVIRGQIGLAYEPN